MSEVMDEEIKRWTARTKSALVLEIIQGRTTVSEASRQFDLSPSEIEGGVEDGKRGMENALRATPCSAPGGRNRCQRWTACLRVWLPMCRHTLSPACWMR